jgi:enamidase
LLEEGLVSEDFTELASEGVHLVGEVGISGVKDVETATEMTKWAQSAGMTVTVHVGGKSVAGSRSIDGAFCAILQPDVAAHVNGGPTAPSTEDVGVILSETNAFVELVHNGNVRAARDVCRLLMDQASLARAVIGTDSPAGAGIAPAGVLRTLAWLCALADLQPATAVAMASGNTARARRIPGGRIEVDAPADLVIADAPDGSTAHDMAAALQVGDTPAVAGVVIAGQIVIEQSRNTPPPRRTPSFPPK